MKAVEASEFRKLLRAVKVAKAVKAIKVVTAVKAVRLRSLRKLRRLRRLRKHSRLRRHGRAANDCWGSFDGLYGWVRMAKALGIATAPLWARASLSELKIKSLTNHSHVSKQHNQITKMVEGRGLMPSWEKHGVPIKFQ